eukprot:m51a1_g12585 hypothetical protein (287) ;mRNA; f:21-938
MTNVAAEVGVEPGPHFGVGAEVYARFSSPMREIEGTWLHRELVELLGIEKEHADVRLRASVVESARAARRLQGQLTKDANRLAIDAVFAGDLAWPPAARPVRRGTVLGIGRDKQRVYVELDNPPVEVKMYLGRLEQRTGRPYDIDREAASVRIGDTLIRVGDAVGLRVVAGASADEPWIVEPVCGPVADAYRAVASTKDAAAAAGRDQERGRRRLEPVAACDAGAQMQQVRERSRSRSRSPFGPRLAEPPKPHWIHVVRRDQQQQQPQSAVVTVVPPPPQAQPVEA